MQPISQLIPFDVNNAEHVDITYEILQFRFKNSERINISNDQLPTKEQHIANITNGQYKYYYVAWYRGYYVGIIYINNNNEFGTFLHPKNAYTVYKKHKGEIDKGLGTIAIGEKKVTRMVYFFGMLTFRILLDMHPDLNHIKAKVNYDNFTSRQFAEFGYKFKPKYIYYEYER